ncbi:MAG TPA: hypothetical protein P5277_02045 [Candidatus Paceibacterota bacterium]|nr:hypothetical protein [Candidatus Paceibacterota bacterium]
MARVRLPSSALNIENKEEGRNSVVFEEYNFPRFCRKSLGLSSALNIENKERKNRRGEK